MYIVTTKIEIERIRNLAREQGVDLAVQGILCLPQDIKKYLWVYFKASEKRQCNGLCSYNTTQISISQRPSILKLMLTNISVTQMSEMVFQSKIDFFEDRLEVELLGGKTFICNLDNLGIVELHTWYCSSNGYVVTSISGVSNKQFFHNIVMKHVPLVITVNHINRNGLDNCPANLRVVDKKTQSINQGCQVNNKTGMIGICFYNKSKSWIASWKDASGNNWNKCFSSNKYGDVEAKAMTIEYRQSMIRLLPHYVEALQLDADGPQV